MQPSQTYMETCGVGSSKAPKKVGNENYVNMILMQTNMEDVQRLDPHQPFVRLYAISRQNYPFMGRLSGTSMAFAGQEGDERTVARWQHTWSHLLGPQREWEMLTGAAESNFWSLVAP